MVPAIETSTQHCLSAVALVVRLNVFLDFVIFSGIPLGYDITTYLLIS